MRKMLSLIRKQLVRVLDDIDTGNTHMTEEEETKLLDFLKELNSREKYLSKYQAYTFLNISRAKFDNMVKEGKIPEGIKIPGFKELRWKESVIRKLALKENK